MPDEPKKKPKNPRILPEVKYEPRTLYGDAVNASEQFGPALNAAAASLQGGLSAAGNYLAGGAEQKVGRPDPNYAPKVAYMPNVAPVGQTPPGWQPTFNPDAGVSGSAQLIPNGPPTQPSTPDPVGQTPPGFNPGPSQTPAPMAGPGNAETVAAWQATLDKNRSLNDKATAAGNDKEMKRLDDEWARLISTPQYQKLYGGSNEADVKNRLINSYMQPGNDAAESSMDRAAGRMIADDAWAAEMDAAGAWGSDPDRMWAEHWHAMNKGGRDPLEGHPQAIQNLERKRKEMEQMNQQASYDALQQWLTNSGNV
jgi:hypothetical protein